MTEPLIRPWHPLAKMVQTAIGRNLLIYQIIEHQIKLYVPYIHPDGSKSGLESFRRLRAFLAEKPLGTAVEKFKQSLTHNHADAAQAFDDELQAVLRARNTMTHGFLTTPGVSLETEEGCKEAIRLLDENLKQAMPLANLLAAHVALLGSAMGALEDEEVQSIFQLLGGTLQVMYEEESEAGNSTPDPPGS